MDVFEWSTPARRKGSQPLDSIPLEIYQEIFEYFCENDDMPRKDLQRNLINLSYVCRFFSSIALPRLFAKMNFNGAAGQENGESLRTNRFCRALNNNQEPAKTLAQHVRICAFTSWGNHGGTDTAARIRDAFLTISVFLDKRILKAMKKLQSIKSLSFMRCTLAPDLEMDMLTKFLQSLRLRSLVIFQCGRSQTVSLDEVIPPALSLDALTTLEVDDWSMVKRLANHDQPLPLQTLTMHNVEDPTLLPALFNNVPKLRRLHIYIIISKANNLDSIHFPETMIPHLSYFDGPPALAARLVPSRPVRKVWLMGTLKRSLTTCAIPILPKLDHRLWEELKKSKASIEELLIPEHIYATASLREYLQSVSSLLVSWWHANWDTNLFLEAGSRNHMNHAISELCNAWPPNPSVKRLAFELSLAGPEFPVLLNLQWQHEALHSMIVQAFPNIEQVNFVTCTNWRRFPSDDTWRVEIPKAKKRHVWALWNNDRDQLVDYGGVFEALFNPESPDFNDYADA